MALRGREKNKETPTIAVVQQVMFIQTQISEPRQKDEKRTVYILTKRG